MNLKLNPKKSGVSVFIISEKKFIYTLLLLFLPIIDMFNGYGLANGYIAEGGLASPSQISRALMLCIFLYIFFKYKMNISIIIFFIPLFITEFLMGIFLQETFGVSYGVMSIYKLVYVVITGTLLSFLVKDRNDIYLFSKFLKINILIISTSIYFSLYTGLGASTYGWGFGTKSFFASGNGLGIYLGIVSLTLIALNYYKLSVKSSVFTYLYVIFSIACIGTKTSFVLCLIILLALIFISKQRYFLIFISCCIFFVFSRFIFEYFPILFDVIISRAEHTDSFGQYVSSGRADYIMEAFSIFTASDSNMFRLLFGSGAFLSFQDPNNYFEFDTLETDFFDLLFMYGLYGLIFYLSCIIYIMYLLRSHLFMLLIFLLLISHSLFLGHVLFNGMSSILLAMFFFMAKYFSLHKIPPQLKE